MTVDRATRSQTHCTAAEIRICVCPRPGSSLRWAKKNTTYPIRTRNRCFITIRTGYVVYFKLQVTAVFSLVISLFLHRKRSYFEVLIKLKKIGDTICDPCLIFKKIFSLRHHGVKSFWTKVGGFPPMPLLLGLKQLKLDKF